MKNLSRLNILVLVALVLGACSSSETQIEEDNRELFEYLQQEYFWNNELPAQIDTSAYDSMPDAMNALRAPDDRFSFVMTDDEYDDYAASIFFGYGFSHQNNSAKDGLLIRYVYSEGSAAQNGLRRGDSIIEVDGVSMADVIAGQHTLSDVFGPNEEGHSIEVTFRKPNGDLVEATFSKSEIVANTVLAYETKQLSVNGQSKDVGYLVFNSFKASSDEELNSAFEKFQRDDIDELILDLRYNSGGRISIANQLSTQIAGDNVDNQIFVQYVHNELQSNKNSTSYFDLVNGSAQLNLDRLIVLTSQSSCSASELVINSLVPFIDVVIIGDETCGKPIGMYPEDINDYVVFAINFQTQNAVGFGDYFDGLTADCSVDENITGDWGVVSEPMLAEAVYYLANNRCSFGAEAFGKLAKKQKRVKADFVLNNFKNDL